VTTRLVVGITGASGAIYGIRLLEVLRVAPGFETHLVIGPAGKRAIAAETDWAVEDVERLAARVHDDRDVDAAIAGGALRTAAMVIAPCGLDTVAAIAHSLAPSLIARVADVTLREGRRLVVVPREAPLHLGHLRALLALAEMGAVILPPLPAFYPRPQTIDDVVNHTVGRALDHLGVPHALVQEWTGTARARRSSLPRAGG
jgi:polyprenyl P-hydroxybenzoate/phenylacrylic acid decarboxylase-like protein